MHGADGGRHGDSGPRLDDPLAEDQRREPETITDMRLSIMSSRGRPPAGAAGPSSRSRPSATRRSRRSRRRSPPWGGAIRPRPGDHGIERSRVADGRATATSSGCRAGERQAASHVCTRAGVVYRPLATTAKTRRTAIGRVDGAGREITIGSDRAIHASAAAAAATNAQGAGADSRGTIASVRGATRWPLPDRGHRHRLPLHPLPPPLRMCTSAPTDCQPNGRSTHGYHRADGGRLLFVGVYLGLTDEQLELRDSARSALARECPRGRYLTSPPGRAEPPTSPALSWLRLPPSPSTSTSAGSVAASSSWPSSWRRWAGLALPGSFLPTQALFAPVVREAGTTAQAHRFLAGVAAGELPARSPSTRGSLGPPHGDGQAAERGGDG